MHPAAELFAFFYSLEPSPLSSSQLQPSIFYDEPLPGSLWMPTSSF